ncbi:hypothetical protein QT972_11580 [Microcoleus sp. herbarium7]
MHPDGFPVPQERDFYWENIVLSFKTAATDRIGGTFPSNDRQMPKYQSFQQSRRFGAIEPIALTRRNNPKAVA